MRCASHRPWLPMAHASSLFLRDRCAISDRYPPIWWPKAACPKRLGWSFAFASHGFDGAWWHPSKPSQPMGCSADAGDVRVVSPSALSHLQGPDHPLAHASLRTRTVAGPNEHLCHGLAAHHPTAFQPTAAHSAKCPSTGDCSALCLGTSSSGKSEIGDCGWRVAWFHSFPGMKWTWLSYCSFLPFFK